MTLHFLFFSLQNETRVLVTEEEVIEDASQNPTQEEEEDSETIFVDMTTATASTTTPDVTSQVQDGDEDEGKSLKLFFTSTLLIKLSLLLLFVRFTYLRTMQIIFSPLFFPSLEFQAFLNESRVHVWYWFVLN
jgi:hypothetical protein